MTTLIVYYSYTDNNALLARALQRQLDCESQRIEEVRRRSGFTILFDLLFKRHPRLKPIPLDLHRYACVVLVAPIWAGRIATPMRASIERHGPALADYAFATVCTGLAGQAEQIEHELLDLLQRPPRAFMELKINDRLPTSQRDTIRGATRYHIGSADLVAFQPQIGRFVQALSSASPRPPGPGSTAARPSL